MPGTIGFAALVATWVALYEAESLAPPSLRLACGLALTLLAWARLPRRPREPAVVDGPARGRDERRIEASDERWDERWLRGLAAALILLGGLVPSRVLARLVPYADARAAEVELSRCADLELWELRRARLRAEMSVDCGDAAAEIGSFYGVQFRVDTKESPRPDDFVDAVDAGSEVSR